MRCPACAAELTGEERSCPRCGVEVEPVEPSREPTVLLSSDQIAAAVSSSVAGPPTLDGPAVPPAPPPAVDPEAAIGTLMVTLPAPPKPPEPPPAPEPKTAPVQRGTATRPQPPPLAPEPKTAPVPLEPARRPPPTPAAPPPLPGKRPAVAPPAHPPASPERPQVESARRAPAQPARPAAAGSRRSPLVPILIACGIAVVLGLALAAAALWRSPWSPLRLTSRQRTPAISERSTPVGLVERMATVAPTENAQPEGTVLAEASATEPPVPTAVDVIQPTAAPTAAAVSNRAPGIPTAGLVGWWRFEEGAGTVASDSSGNGLTAAVVGASFVPGRFGYGLALDNGGFLELPSSPRLDALQAADFTLAVWFAPFAVPAAPQGQEPEQYGIVVKAGWHEGLTYTTEQRFSMQHWLEGNQFHGAFSGATFAPAVFHHLAGVVDRGAGATRLYVNGRLEGSVSWPPTSAARDFGATRWRVGIADPSSPEWRWAARGVVDELALYSRALGEREIAALASGPAR